jgi:SAM-dependent methyltransferase
MSVFGCMIAPDQRAAAAEIARVLEPGGRIAIAAWTPEGAMGKFFATSASHMPPPPEGFQPPVLWGTEDHVRELFEGTGVEPELEKVTVDFVGESPEAMLTEFEQKLPPLVAAKAALEPQGKWDALRADVLEVYESTNEAGDSGYRAPAEYLVTTGTKA